MLPLELDYRSKTWVRQLISHTPLSNFAATYVWEFFMAPFSVLKYCNLQFTKMLHSEETYFLGELGTLQPSVEITGPIIKVMWSTVDIKWPFRDLQSLTCKVSLNPAL